VKVKRLTQKQKNRKAKIMYEINDILKSIRIADGKQNFLVKKKKIIIVSGMINYSLNEMKNSTPNVWV